MRVENVECGGKSVEVHESREMSVNESGECAMECGGESVKVRVWK